MNTFEKRFKNGLLGLHSESSGFSYICPECIDYYGFCCKHSAKAAYEKGEIVDEPSFSHESCDICNSNISGNRYIAHAMTKNNDILHLEICQDCVLYMANGDLPMD
jgi:hypothetical protein